ncbi:Inosine-5'-monophosphate dehydrogenase [uncultured archaeon]|nr:Inosine-5'-monophosphate dehydrogenase [uncultured archaeon]
MKEIEELTVGDVMTRGVITVNVDDPVKKAAEVMKKYEISALLVLQKGEGIGVLTERDIICKVVADSKDASKTPVSTVMSHPLITVSPESSVDNAARLMRDNSIRRLIVTQKNKIAGIITESDIVRVEPELHLLIREKARMEISDAYSETERENRKEE